MTRRLPWKRSELNGPDDKKTSSLLSTSGTKHASPSPRPPAIPRSTPARPARARLQDREKVRSPSTSPPPEPPKEEFMIPEDDKYRMVEDEFYLTAQRFTTHLHRQEYNRLKALAKSRNAIAISEIERPVVGPGTLVSRRRTEMAERDRKQRSAGERVGVSRTGLSGLMEGSRGEEGDVVKRFGEGRVRDGGSVVLGRKRAVEEVNDQTDEDEDDDLGLPPLPSSSVKGTIPGSSRIRPTAFSTPIATKIRPKISSTPLRAKASASKSRSERLAPRNPTTPTTVPLNDGEEEEEEDDDDLFGINKRRSRREKSRNQTHRTAKDAVMETPPPRKQSPDLIPSFL